MVLWESSIILFSHLVSFEDSMKRYSLAGLLGLIISFSCIAQDVIIKRSGEEIKAKVKTVLDTEVQYTSPDQEESRILKSEVLLIIYEDGRKDIFQDNSTSSVVSGNTGIARPAQVYYEPDFFDRKIPLTFLGVDFSRAKVVGSSFENLTTLFEELNAILLKEKNKFDFPGAVRKPDLQYNLSLVEQRNKSVQEASLRDNTPNISYNDLQAIIDTYDLDAVGLKDGLGMVLLCDHLHEVRKDGAYYYIIFDVASKKILIADRLIGRAGGANQRNYWANSIHGTISELKDKKYALWKRMYRP